MNEKQDYPTYWGPDDEDGIYAEQETENYGPPAWFAIGIVLGGVITTLALMAYAIYN